MDARFLLVIASPLSKAMEYSLWKRVAEGGIYREDCALLSILPVDPDGASGEPTQAQLQKYLPEFRRRLDRYNPQCIIPMGGTAFRLVTGLRWGIDQSRGYVIHADECRPMAEKARVQVGTYKRDGKTAKAGDPKMALREITVPSYIPSAWRRPPADRPNERFIVPCVSIEYLITNRLRPITAFLNPIQVAREYADGEPLVDNDFRWQDGPLLAWAYGATAFDLETDLNGGAIERASVSHESAGTHTFRWDSGAAANIEHVLANAALRIAHNIQFDEPVLRRHGIIVPEPWWDTMLAAQLLEPDLPKALASVAPLFLRTTPWKHLAQERGFADPFYSAKDAFIERKLYEAERAELERQGMLELFQKRLMPSVPVLIDMKEKGMRLDQRVATEWTAELTAKREALLRQWHAEFTENPFSTKDARDLLYGKWGLPAKRNKRDGITVDELALKELIAEAPQREGPLRLLLALRETNKLLGTYAKVSLGKDYVHPSYLPMGKDDEGPYGKGGAATGRLSASGPNVQQEPKVARRMYIPDDPSMVWVSFDQKQAEVRIGAARSGDTALLEALKGDVHAYTMQVVGCDRTRAKNVLFGSAYGAGPKKLKDTLFKEGVVVSHAEIKELQQALARTYPVWWAWRYEVANLATAQGFLRAADGRIRRFPMRADDAPAAMNFYPQADVGGMMWALLRPLWELARHFGGRLTTQVHDEYLFQVPRSRVREFVPAARELLEREFPEIAPGFRIPVECKVGNNWGVMVPYDQWRNDDE